AHSAARRSHVRSPGTGATRQRRSTATYICPMCPGVEAEAPGSCPRCGMSLEPMLLPGSTTEWTCPMHPEVVQDGAGDCPICGMALEPRRVNLEAQENPELVDMRRRFRLSAALTIPLVLVAMSH